MERNILLMLAQERKWKFGELFKRTPGNCRKCVGGRVLPEEELKITGLHGDDENQDIEAATGKTRVRNPYRKLLGGTGHNMAKGTT